MRWILALLLLPACYLSHEVGADVARDAGRDASVDVRRDTGTVDTGTPTCVDRTIPMSADGCCETDRQACTHDCGSFVIFCDEGCCHFTGP